MVSPMSQTSTSSFIATYSASLDSASPQRVMNVRYPGLPHLTSSLRTGSFGQQWCDTSLLLRDSGGLSSPTFILYFCSMDLTLILWPYVWYAVSAGDRPHHVMTDETFPSFGCREASDLIAVWTFPTLHPFPCRQTWFVFTIFTIFCSEFA
jgi:hypothetical protein